MPRVVREDKQKAKRNEILDVAAQLIYSKGYEKMTIQDILDQLQISKGAFYHYFESKAAVLEALIERMAAEQAAPILFSIVDDPQLTALEKLHRYFDTSLRWKSARKAFIMELVKVGYSDENALFRQKSFIKMLEYLRAPFTKIIEQGVQERVFSVPYPEITSQVIINLVQSLADRSMEILISEKPDSLQRAETLFAAYSDALERILGAPKGSIQFMSGEALKEWFSSDNSE
jgi:AcrR family transcriptional regulator